MRKKACMRTLLEAQLVQSNTLSLLVISWTGPTRQQADMRASGRVLSVQHACKRRCSSLLSSGVSWVMLRCSVHEVCRAA